MEDDEIKREVLITEEVPLDSVPTDNTSIDKRRTKLPKKKRINIIGAGILAIIIIAIICVVYRTGRGEQNKVVKEENYPIIKHFVKQMNLSSRYSLNGLIIDSIYFDERRKMVIEQYYYEPQEEGFNYKAGYDYSIYHQYLIDENDHSEYSRFIEEIIANDITVRMLIGNHYYDIPTDHFIEVVNIAKNNPKRAIEGLIQSYIDIENHIMYRNSYVQKKKEDEHMTQVGIRLETGADGQSYIVTDIIDCLSEQGGLVAWINTDENYQEMKKALKSDVGRIDGSQELLQYAYMGGKGLGFRYMNYNRADTCAFFYSPDEIVEMYDNLPCSLNEMKNRQTSTNRVFDIGDYTISIPETMYLSDDQSFGIVYNFMQKDPNGYARIQVKIEYDENAAEYAALFNEGWQYSEDEAREFRQFIMQQSIESGMEVSEVTGPDFVKIDGDNIFHSSMVRKAPSPTRVDTYQFYTMNNKNYIITTSYHIEDAIKWKDVIRESILSIKKK